MKPSTIQLKDISFNENIYPRAFGSNWHLIVQYKGAMQTGAIFPPLVVATVNGKISLIDGYHRLQAYTQSGVKEAQAYNLGELSEQEALIQAIKRNTTHGCNLTVTDKIAMADKLTKYGLSYKEVSGLLYYPVESLKKVVVSRIAYAGVGGTRTVVLPKSREHRAQTIIAEPSGEMRGLNSGLSTIYYAEQLNILCRNNEIDTSNLKLVEELTQLRDNLNALISKENA